MKQYTSILLRSGDTVTVPADSIIEDKYWTTVEGKPAVALILSHEDVETTPESVNAP